jgi:hypothetical protein
MFDAIEAVQAGREDPTRNLGIDPLTIPMDSSGRRARLRRMAIALDLAAVFEPGQVVGVWPELELAGWQPERPRLSHGAPDRHQGPRAVDRAPRTEPILTATVDADGKLELAGLDSGERPPGTSYCIGALIDGTWRSVRVQPG